MKKITQLELNDIIKEHNIWLSSYQEKGAKADFYYSDLTGLKFNNSNIEYINFDNALLTNVSFIKCDITKCQLTSIDFNNTRFENTTMFMCNMNASSFYNVEFNSSSMNRIDMSKMKDISNTKMIKSTLTAISLKDKYIKNLEASNSKFLNCSMFFTNFNACNMPQTYFQNCNISDAAFINSNLTNSIFKDCSGLSAYNKFNGTELKNAKFNGTALIELLDNMYGRDIRVTDKLTDILND